MAGQVKEKRLVAVKLNYDFAAFGVNTSQLSETMTSLKIRWDGQRVIVTSPSAPGIEKHIHQAGIKETTFKVEDES